MKTLLMLLLASTALAADIPPGAWTLALDCPATLSQVALPEHRDIIPPTAAQPALGASFTQPETGVTITRMTDVSACKNPYSANPPAYDGRPGAGLHNGYARWPNVTRDNRYFLSFGSTAVCGVHSTSPTAFIRLLTHKQGSSTLKIGDGNEPRWDVSGRHGTNTHVYYTVGAQLWRQDALAGHESQDLICALPAGVVASYDGTMDDACRYRAVKLKSGYIAIIDLCERRILPGMPTIQSGNSAGGTDVSPDGVWVQRNSTSTDPRYSRAMFRISDLATSIIAPVYMPGRGGHGAWAWSGGRSVFVWQNSGDDWITSFDPATGEATKLYHLQKDLGSYYINMHVGRTPRAAEGWALISTYSSSDTHWAYNQLFLIELAPHGQVLRIGHTYNYRWVNGVDVGGYFAEAFASMAHDGQSVWWGANALAGDNLEVYRATLPEGWQAGARVISLGAGQHQIEIGE